MKNVHIWLIAFILLTATFGLTGCSDENVVHMCPSGRPGGNQQMTGNDVFVCPDGSKTRSLNGCSYPLKKDITRRTAKDNAKTFIRGYVSSQGWTSNIVNINLVNQSYEAQVVVSKHEKKPFQTILKVDSETGNVYCKHNCDYVS